MKRLFLIISLLITLFASAQTTHIQYGFASSRFGGYDYFTNADANAYIELVVFTPNGDTLDHAVGSDVSVMDGTAVKGIDYNMPTSIPNQIFPKGTNVRDTANLFYRKKIMLNLIPNTVIWGSKYFYLNLTNYVGIDTSVSLYYKRDLLTIFISYDGTNIGLSKLAASEYRLYPNPVRDKIFIEGADVKNYVLTDLTGREVLRGDNVFYNEINISTLQSGIYMLRSETSKGLLIHKIIKE